MTFQILVENKDKLIKGRRGNVGKFARWQTTSRGIKIWLENDDKKVIDSILMKDIKQFEDEEG